MLLENSYTLTFGQGEIVWNKNLSTSGVDLELFEVISNDDGFIVLGSLFNGDLLLDGTTLMNVGGEETIFALSISNEGFFLEIHEYLGLPDLKMNWNRNTSKILLFSENKDDIKVNGVKINDESPVQINLLTAGIEPITGYQISGNLNVVHSANGNDGSMSLILSGEGMITTPVQSQAINDLGVDSYFLCKILSDGTVESIIEIGNSHNITVIQQLFDPEGNIVLSMSFENSISIDDELLYSAGAKDIALVKVSQGNHSILQYGGTTDEIVKGITFLDGQLILGGDLMFSEFGQIIEIGNNLFYNATSSSSAFQKAFMASVDLSDFDNDGVFAKKLIEGSGLEMDDFELFSSIRVSPNPFWEDVEVVFPNSFTNEEINVSITNTLGVIVVNKQIRVDDRRNSWAYKLNLSNLPPGSYFFSFSSENHRTVT